MNKVCAEHFTEYVNKEQLDYIQTITKNEDINKMCDFENCNKQAEFVVFGNSDKMTLSLPNRKEVIINMLNEVKLAIEIGAVVQFMAEDQYMAQMPDMTKYTFLVNKNQLITELNQRNQGK